MAPKPEDVWNARLVRGLKARYYYEQSKGGRSFQWQKGYQIVEAVRKDIYMFNSGRIANLPKDLGSQTVAQEVTAIIKGDRPVIPAEMEAHDPERPGFVMPSAVEDLSQHPYLRKMVFRGGGYALLMAWEGARRSRGADYRGPMCKSLLIQRAQPFCDEPMETNYFAGRLISGWKSMERLVEHGFVEKLNKFAERAAMSFNRGPQDEFRLTDKGAKFIEAVLQKYPPTATQFSDALGSPGGGRGAPSIDDWRDALDEVNHSHHRRRRTGVSPGSAGASAGKSKHLHRQDEDELRAWAATAQPDEVKQFRVGKDRRLALHRACELIGGLKTQSHGLGRQRTLMVLKTSANSNVHVDAPQRSASSNVHSDVAGRDILSSPRSSHVVHGLPSLMFEPPVAPAAAPPTPLASSAAAGRGHRLGHASSSGGSPGVSGKADAGMTPQQRAAAAAMKRLQQTAPSTPAPATSTSTSTSTSTGSVGARAHGGGSGALGGSAAGVDSGVGEESEVESEADSEAGGQFDEREETLLQEAIRRSLADSMAAAAPPQPPPQPARSPAGGASQQARTHAPQGAPHRERESALAGGAGSSTASSSGGGRRTSLSQSGRSKRRLSAVAERLCDEVVVLEDSDDEQAAKAGVKRQRRSAVAASGPEAADGDCVDLCASSEDESAGGNMEIEIDRDDDSDDVVVEVAPGGAAERRGAGDIGVGDGVSSPGCEGEGKASVPGARPQAPQRDGETGGGAGWGSGAMEVRVVVDERERMRNRAPRGLMDMIAAAVERAEETSEAGAAGGARAGRRRAVMETLAVGDYLWEVLNGEEEEEEEARLAEVVVERKRVSDLVGRSKDGDHLRQVAVLRELGLAHSLLLVEGSAEAAKRNRVFGLECAEEHVAGAAAGSSVVQTAEDVWEMVVWLLVSGGEGGAGQGAGRVAVVQTRDEEHTASVVALLCEVVKTIARAQGPAATLCREELRGRVRRAREGPTLLESVLGGEGFGKSAARAVVARFGTARGVLAAREAAGERELVSVADMQEYRRQTARARLLGCCERVAEGVNPEREQEACRASLMRKAQEEVGQGQGQGRGEEVAEREAGRVVVVRWNKALEKAMLAEGQAVGGPGVRAEVCCGQEGRGDGWGLVWCERGACGEAGGARSTPVVVVRAGGEQVVEAALAAAEAVGAGACMARVAWASARAVAGRVREAVRRAGGGGEGGTSGGGGGGEGGASGAGDGVGRPELPAVLVVLEGLWTACRAAQRRGTQSAAVRGLQGTCDILRLYLTMWGEGVLAGEEGRLHPRPAPPRSRWQVVYTANRRETATAVQATVAVVHTQAMLFPSKASPRNSS